MILRPVWLLQLQRPIQPRARADLRRFIGAFLILSVLAAILLLPVLGGDRVLFPRDARSVIPWRYNTDAELRITLERERINDVLTDKNVFDYPKLHAAYRLWREEGKVPLWSPYTFCGNPLVASAMPSPLYPGNWLFLVDSYRGFTWAAFIHLVLSGFFVFLYLRALGMRATAGLLAGTTYAFSGWYLTHLYLPSYIYAATWFPLMLLSVERLVRGGGFLWIGALAGAAALSVLAGFPQVTVFSLYLAGLYTLFRLPGAWRRHGYRPAALRCGGLLLGVALGLGLAAFQILPMFELKAHSGRAYMDLEDIRGGSLRPLGLLGLVMPDFFGNPADQGPATGTGRRPGPLMPRKLGLDGPPPPEDWGNNYLENAHYIGILPLLLALVALIRRPRPVTYFWFAVAVFALLMSVAFPPFRPIYESGPFLRIGGIKRFLFVFTAAGAILAGIGFDGAVGAGRPRYRWGVLPYLPAILLVVTAGPLLVFPDLLRHLLGEMARLTPLTAYSISDISEARDMADWVENTRWCILRVAAVLLPASAIYFLLRHGVRPRPLRFAVLVITFLDLAWLGYRFNPVHRPDQLQPTPGIEFLSRPDGRPPFRVARYGEYAHFVLPPNTGAVFGIQDVQGWDVLFPARYQRFMNLIEPGIGQAHHLIGPFRDHRSLTSPLVDLLGVRYVLTHEDWGPNPALGFLAAYPLDASGGFDKERIAREGLVVYENADAVPRAFLVAKAELAANEDDAFKWLEDRSKLADFDPSGTVILEGPSETPPALDARAEVKVTGYQSRHVTVEVGPGGPAVLVLTDAFFPAWTAALEDGTALPIHRADGIFRAVVLDRRQTPTVVHFHHPGLSFRSGVYLAAAAAVVLLLVLLVGGYRTLIRNRRRTRPQEG